ncbi:DUF507 family protein [Campylobacter sp. FMV-PI01]|uniref:DUF507 family protein n=1 Tax=Campylobacter portucalensis TaxID=2608384 RepID=A0A6L5WJF0_9BACT|nr:DUF507 family protein [Campylobacter portucalensis]MSN96145.1 DUF507 family protein [Campylobacter portucalensis]
MRIKFPHIPYISRKIAIDMLNSGFIKFNKNIESVSKVADEILREDLTKERAIEERANELLEENSENMYIMQVDRKNMFWMVKKRLADDAGFVLNHEDRYNNISHAILETSWKKDLIDYKISENKARNVIYSSIEEYLKIFVNIENLVYDTLDENKKFIPGSDEYDLEFQKLYEMELKKRGMF